MLRTTDQEVLSSIESLAGRPLSSLTQTSAGFGYLARGERVVHLAINRVGLTSLPERLGELTALRELYLYGNRISRLPESLGGLVELTRLDLEGNGLTALPRGLSSWHKLEKLWCGHNALTDLPEDIGELSALQEL